MIKLCFIDVETTGLDPKLNGIIQIAGIIAFQDRGKFDVIEDFNFRVQPFPFDIIDQRALHVNGITEQQISHFPQPEEVISLLTSILDRYIDKNNPHDKAFFVGFNAKFDQDFVMEFFNKCANKEYKKYFYLPALDVMQLALFRLSHERASMPNFKLKTVAEYLNVRSEGDFHDAMTDIEATKGIYLFCTPLLQLGQEY